MSQLKINGTPRFALKSVLVWMITYTSALVIRYLSKNETKIYYVAVSNRSHKQAAQAPDRMGSGGDTGKRS